LRNSGTDTGPATSASKTQGQLRKPALRACKKHQQLTNGLSNKSHTTNPPEKIGGDYIKKPQRKLRFFCAILT